MEIVVSQFTVFPPRMHCCSSWLSILFYASVLCVVTISQVDHLFEIEEELFGWGFSMGCWSTVQLLPECIWTVCLNHSMPLVVFVILIHPLQAAFRYQRMSPDNHQCSVYSDILDFSRKDSLQLRASWNLTSYWWCVLFPLCVSSPRALWQSYFNDLWKRRIVLEKNVSALKAS